VNVFLSVIRHDTGAILRGTAAVVALVVFGVVALFSGPTGWVAFAGMLAVSAVLTGLNVLFSSIGQRREARRYEQRVAAPRATASSTGNCRPKPSTAPPQADPLANRALALGAQYATDIDGIGDDAVALLRRDLEQSFGEDAVTRRWDEILPLLESASKERWSR
jgi:hypothetical protein